MVHRVTTNDNKWQHVVERVTTNDNEWQRVATNDNEWQRVVQRVTTSDKEWQRVTTSDKECQRAVQRVTTNTTNDIPANFSFFFQIKEKPTTKHRKENFLNLEEDLWRRPIELKAGTSIQKEILTVRSRNYRSSCSQIFTKIMFLKILQYSPFNRFAGFQTFNYLKKGLQRRCFPVNIAKFLKTAFSIEHLRWLLLELRHFLVCDV